MGVLILPAAGLSLLAPGSYGKLLGPKPSWGEMWGGLGPYRAVWVGLGVYAAGLGWWLHSLVPPGAASARMTPPQISLACAISGVVSAWLCLSYFGVVRGKALGSPIAR